MRLVSLGISGLALAACATQVSVPANLQFPDAERAALQLHAEGVQIYECKASAQDATKLQWVFKAPEAQLYDASGKLVGKHYAGPSWEGNDGGKVVGQVRAQAESPAADAIPWLLLTAKTSPDNGFFANVRSIQRVNTAGGKAPVECRAAELGTLSRVPYSADYIFSLSR
jgi:Protein of unknown function (DUF3455)